MRNTILLTSLLFSSSIFADVEHVLMQCSSVSDKLDRLICYDKLTDAVKAGKNVTSAQLSAKDSTPKILTVEDSFGLKEKPKDEQIEKIYARVTKVDKNVYGALKITFDNGQVWKQTDARYFKVKIDETLFIKTGALGSFMLGRDNQNTTIRVKRLY
ncbi:hypothetical protein [Shewanella surugensis]|uniref:Uncharacterized protein n=1 Tax=Shewanella surugensis TaxID=212020 RepID=A0ABT0LG30_9GAMM|nr:hypothetical protein [Shewanella surugensis]MCL1126312.1 hypothetical protein [Shewanella surugensis]